MPKSLRKPKVFPQFCFAVLEEQVQNLAPGEMELSKLIKKRDSKGLPRKLLPLSMANRAEDLYKRRLNYFVQCCHLKTNVKVN